MIAVLRMCLTELTPPRRGGLVREFFGRWLGASWTRINRVSDIRELAVPPGNRLEPLRGSRSGQHSIRINDQYRICFRWEAGYADEVEITDYH